MGWYGAGEDDAVTFARLDALHAVALGDTDRGLVKRVHGLIEEYRATEEALRG